MPQYCEWKAGCGIPGLYTIPSPDVVPVPIRVCDRHRAAWVESLTRRTRWPCAIDGCKRVAQVDGLCEPCWIAIRAHDELVKGEVQPSLARLSVRHAVKGMVPPRPTDEDIGYAARSVESLALLSRQIAAHAGRAPAELVVGLEEASQSMSDVVAKAAALAKVKIKQQEKAKQGGLFDVR